jgi:ribosomal protein S12 methylthiotransferase accessory factor
MQVNVKFLDNLKVEASFDDYTIVADQPVRYKGEGLAPSPFDYFLASSALCAAYFVKVYCKARDISTDDIRITQNNIVDPENRYAQTFQIEVELPDYLSEKDRTGILAAIERCTVKKVIQQSPIFNIIARTTLESDNSLIYQLESDNKTQTHILGKDKSLEETARTMSKIITDLGIKIEIASWRNPIPHVWSVHIRDADCPINYTNGKGATKEAALCSALGEFIERLSTNYFYADYYLGHDIAHSSFVHYPNERWFPIDHSGEIPVGLMDENIISLIDPEQELNALNLIDTNSGNKDRGICALPFERQSDKNIVYIPVNVIGNLFVSNGMSAGNTPYEARVQCLSEIFERAIKNKIISEEIALPDIPREILQQYPNILEGIAKLESEGYPIVVKDASLGGLYPVLCVALLNPKTGGAYASFGAHPIFEVALERSLTELLQGRSFEGLNDMPAPTFNCFAVQEHNNLIDHFIDSSGVISWKFFSQSTDLEFSHWNFSGTTEQEFKYLMNILKELEKEVYIADYHDLGAYACRILVPGFSEIYQCEDLKWDNNNKALEYRQDILSLHSLNKKERKKLLQKLNESELDEQMPISELIGINFDENSPWGKLTIGELKCHLHLSLQNLNEAKELADIILAFNEFTDERKKFYQLLNIVLDISLDDSLDIQDYQVTLERVYGDALVQTARKVCQGEIVFLGLTPTDENLSGLDKHCRLIDSYKKIHAKRSLAQSSN